MNQDTLPEPWEDDPLPDTRYARLSSDTPELEISRLYKLKVDLLMKLRSAPPRQRQGIVERLKQTDRRIKNLQHAPTRPAKIPSSAG